MIYKKIEKMTKKIQNDNRPQPRLLIIDWILRFFKGALIGTGFILPGVSGGALAAIFGLYQRIVSFIAHITRDFIKNCLFFIPIGFGALFGMFLLARPLSFFLENYNAQVIWGFIGCIIGTLPSLWKEAGKEGRHIPIIALTANAITGQREMFLKNGIDDFLAKPIDIQKLNEILGKWIPSEKRVDAVQASEPNETGETKPEKTESLSIPGMDIEAGLRNVGGSKAVYLDIIADFCRDLESRTVNLRQALDSGNTKLYITLVHALKGAARSIGAMETGEAAAWLENAAGKEDEALIRRKNDELLENLRTLSANIKAAANQRDSEGGGLTVLCLETLRSALSEMDIEAVNKMLLEYSSLSLDNQTREIVAELEQHILMFEYDEAVKKIDQLQGQSNG